jgi:restriction system protein
VQLTPTTNDGGIDLVLRQGTQSILVQCKAHKAPVGPGPVRDLFGTLTHRGGTQAWLVATSSFSKGADSFARGKPIRLVAIRDLLNED